MAFVAAIEKKYFTESPAVFRKHHTTAEFLKKWNLEVYFRIRVKELVGGFEKLFGDNISGVIVSDNSETANGLRLFLTLFSWHHTNSRGWTGFLLIQSAGLMTTLGKIWKEDRIFVPELTPQFWKLTLQCLNRYLHWVKTLLVSLQVTLKEISEVKIFYFVFLLWVLKNAHSQIRITQMSVPLHYSRQ
jgi:hypothetical protein